MHCREACCNGPIAELAAGKFAEGTDDYALQGVGIIDKFHLSILENMLPIPFDMPDQRTIIIKQSSC